MFFALVRNDCLPQCYNGGTCVQTWNRFFCSCSCGWTGRICTGKIAVCIYNVRHSKSGQLLAAQHVVKRGIYYEMSVLLSVDHTCESRVNGLRQQNML